MSQNENTPQYIKQVPWYAQNEGKQSQPISQKQVQSQDWYSRGMKGFQASVFRKGACENCGAMGHNKKECTERPRKVPARFSQKNIAPDDVQKELQLDWEAKRDRWNGYDNEMYKEVVQEYEELESIRKRVQEQDIDSEYKQSVDPLELATLPSKNSKNKKFQGLGGVRNREDYAKYLLNLDVNSDHFDPKSRSMRSYDNPESQFNNLEVIGERDNLINQDRFAAEQVELHNSELNTFALPTLTEKIYNKIKGSQGANGGNGKVREMLKKYGGETNEKPYDFVEEEEEFVLNNMRQNVKKSNKSRYEEDVMINDHTSVWGSWYNKLLGWGYACCHSTTKESYCLGNKGKEKALAAELKVKAQRLRELQQLEETSKAILEEKEKENNVEGSENNPEKVSDPVEPPQDKN